MQFYKNIIFFLLVFYSLSKAQQLVLDDFNSLIGWNIIKSDGVNTQLKTTKGISGTAAELDFKFTLGTGYCGIQKHFELDLEKDFEFTFYLKGESKINNLEFKLLDSTGENVWWHIKRNFSFPDSWKKFTIKKRDITFAWGPTNNKKLKLINKIEFTVSSVNGGTGSIFIDSLTLRYLPPLPEIIPKIKVTAESHLKNHPPKFIIDNNPETTWRAKLNKTIDKYVIFDFGYCKEIGGLIINWDGLHIPGHFSIYISKNGDEWVEIYNLTKNKRRYNFIQLPNPSAQYLKIIINPGEKDIVGISEIRFMNYQFSEDNNYFFEKVADYYPEGIFPRYYYGRQSYWTVTGADKSSKEALLNEDGMIEPDKQSFSVSPFVKTDSKIFSWNDIEKSTNLSENYLPFPNVILSNELFRLKVSCFSDAYPDNPVLYMEYELTNLDISTRNFNLFLTFRPFQVNPPWQSLNFKGGFTPIKEFELNKTFAEINDKTIIFAQKPDDLNVLDFERISLYKFLAGQTYYNNNLSKLNPFSSIVAQYNLQLAPQEGRKIVIAIPFEEYSSIDFNQYNQIKQETSLFWKRKLNKVDFITSPKAKTFLNTLKTNLAYILINKDKSGIQPGSRTYERSWIRDGALTSTALLEFGLEEEVKEYIKWYRNYIYPNGKIPCVVDFRGPDPVDENDSNGEFIYLISQHFNFTKDTVFLQENFPFVVKAVNYLKTLIGKRSTPDYKNGNDSSRALYGLVPESISHEGYSAKPMHSYWDDFFVLLGLKRARQIAGILNEKSKYFEYSVLEKTFRKNLIASINLSTKLHEIDYIPGSVELGDFDPTSTAISVFPCFEYLNLPQDLLTNTFNKYYEFFINRIESGKWENFTPYELRIVGAFNILGEKEKALNLLDFFMKYRRPSNWNEWAEVVWKDLRSPKFIGDMPHTWVGSGFINSFRSLIAYEDEKDNSLVIASGIKEDWIDEHKGFQIKNLPTYYGSLNYSILKDNESTYSVMISGESDLPGGGIIIKNFRERPIKKVLVNGKTYHLFSNSEIKITNTLPVKIKIFY